MSNQTTDERDALLAALSEKFPKAAIKQREGARGKQLDYLETHTVIHRLNSAAKTWDWKLTQLQQQGDLLIAIGELTIPGLGTRTGIGVQKVSERGGEDLVKGASSDAMKKAATLFGVGLELYGPDYGAAAQAPAKQATPDRSQPAAPPRRSNEPPHPAESQHTEDAEPRALGPRSATEKQLKAVYAIAHSGLGLSNSEVDAKCKDIYGYAPQELSRWEASQFIDLLKQDKVG